MTSFVIRGSASSVSVATDPSWQVLDPNKEARSILLLVDGLDEVVTHKNQMMEYAFFPPAFAAIKSFFSPPSHSQVLYIKRP